MKPESRTAGDGPRRWLLITQYYSPEVGAPQIRLGAFVRQLRRRGIEVEVLTALPNYPLGRIFPGYEGGRRREEIIDGVRVRRAWVYAGTGRSALVRLANYCSFAVTALPIALRWPRPDLIFVESQPLPVGLVALAMKWLRGVPYVYNVPDLQVEAAEQMGFLRNRIALRAAAFLEDLLLRQAEKVSTVTERFVQVLRSRGIPASRVTFLPNGADAQELRPTPPDPELLRRWDLAGKKVFLYVGTHAYYHGLDTLVEAAARLRGREDLAFLMVGDGPERARLMELARTLGASNILWGESPFAERNALYSICCGSLAMVRDLPVARNMRLAKVFPSLSCGVPVIYSGVGEGASVIEQNGCGLTVPPENPAALADAIERLADDAALRRAMASRGRELVLSQYSWETIVDRWLAEAGWSIPDEPSSHDSESAKDDRRPMSKSHA